MRQARKVAQGDYNVRDVILVGPRGSGKTTLLNWVRLHIEDQKRAGNLSSKVRTIGPMSEIGKLDQVEDQFKEGSIFSRFGSVNFVS